MDRSLDKLYENKYFRDAVSVILSIICKKWIDFINTFLAVHYTLMEHVSIDILNGVRE